MPQTTTVNRIAFFPRTGNRGYKPQYFNNLIAYMPDIKAPYVSWIKAATAFDVISVVLDDLPRNRIETVPWPGYSYKPYVSFVIAYTDESILLKYYIHEKSIRGLHAMANTPVHQDSCIEFFISFDADEAYYNLELNCIGTCLFGYGKHKTGRKLIEENIINKIRRQVIINHPAYDHVNWELLAVIPKEAFVYHNITDLKGRQCRVNFYKCGDDLPEPHFLAWKNITAATPDFHLPEFFGNMHFV